MYENWEKLFSLLKRQRSNVLLNFQGEYLALKEKKQCLGFAGFNVSFGFSGSV